MFFLNIDKVKIFQIYICIVNTQQVLEKSIAVVQINSSAKEVQKKASDKNILIDRPKNDKSDNLLLLAFTEKRTKEEIDKLISFLGDI